MYGWKMLLVKQTFYRMIYGQRDIKRNGHHALWWRHQMETFSALLALWEESVGHRWIPLAMTSDAELWCFLLSAPERTVEKTIETPIIWEAVALIMTPLYYVRRISYIPPLMHTQ